MKNIIKLFKKIKIDFSSEKVKIFSSNFDKFYLGIIFVFLLLLSYELIKYLIGYYTIYRAFIVFLIFTIIFLIRKYNERLSVLLKTVNFLKDKKETIVYSSFILYIFIFVFSFIFKSEDLFKNSTIIFLFIYLVFKFLGFKLNFKIKKIDFFSIFFFNILVFSSSIFYILIHKLSTIYMIDEYKIFIYILFISSYVFIFSILFSNIISIIFSRKTKNFLINNIYTIFSIIVITLTIFLLLYKNDLLYIFERHEKNNILNKNIETNQVNTGITDTKTLSGNLDEEIKEEIKEKVYKKIGDIYKFSRYLDLGTNGEDVKKLQDILSNMGYYSGDITGNYDTTTKVSVKNMLMKECDWPSSTLGVFGTQAMACFNNLKIEVETEIKD